MRPAAATILTTLILTACEVRKVTVPVVPTDATIYYNANVVTLDPQRPKADALRIENGRITHVWAGGPQVDATGARVDLGGKTVLPGLVDAHFHLQGLGAWGRRIDLRDTRSAEAVAARVKEAVVRAPAGSWVHGRGWDQNDWPQVKFPTRAKLDAVSGDHPVWLSRIDGHAVWVNSKALALAGITAKTKDPKGGEIIRDETGEPTGILVDNAIDLVADQVPDPTPADLRQDFIEAMRMCREVGLTGVHDMGTSPAELAVLRALDATGELTLRYTAYLYGTDAELAPLLANPPDREGLLRVVGVKLFADGALGSRGAALLDPYSDRPDTKGLLVTSPEELTERAKKVHAAGYQVAIHAIGDRGNRIALDAIAAAQGSDTSRRHRVEHAQVVSLDDIPRFKTLGAIASMQPTHATSDMDWADERLGRDRLAGAYAWRRMIEAGVPLALGSDAPVERHNPWLGVFAAVTRTDGSGAPKGGWLPDQRLKVIEALDGFSRGAAFAAHDTDLGVIKVGALADLTIVKQDPQELSAEALVAVQTHETVVNGQVVFSGE